MIDNQHKRAVRLYGALGSTFGRKYELVVATPAEAVRALCVLVPGFERYLNTSRRRGLTYAVFSGKRNLQQDQLSMDGSAAEIRIVPVIIGSKRAGLLQTVFGAVLVAASYFMPALLSVGLSLMAGGVVQMLSPQTTGLAKSTDEKASYAFGSVTNTASQGYPVPWLYGKRRIGGAIISAGIYVDDLDVYQAQKATGTVTPDARGTQKGDLQSIALARVLVALGEGPFAGELTARDIYLNGTALMNADGTSNFSSGVTWEFRPGTQDQEYIAGIPSVENEISTGSIEVTTAKSWSHTLTNTQLSAARVRLKWPSLFQQKKDGSMGGYRVEYAIDVQADGGAWQTAVSDAVDGTAISGYERTHRVALPAGAKTWTIRVRRITADTTDAKIGSKMTVESYTEIIDAKFRYPNTALLYMEFDSSLFSGQIPTISCEPKGRIINVPSNYTPESKTYTGTWDGTFKEAWTDNPAWIFYDIVTNARFGLGRRLNAGNVDRYELYRVGQYCDAMVPDGHGGSGTEVRYKCDVYIQTREDAFTVVRDFAGIFRGMTCWYNNQLVALADMPRDMDWTFTRANVVDGLFTYAGSTTKARYTTSLVTYSDPDNAYSDAVEAVFENDLVSRFGVNQLELSAVGCTRRSEANRRGRWAILTNNRDRTVEFKVGLDGNLPLPGYIIGIADEMFSGRVTGGRLSAAEGRRLTLDRVPGASAGNRLILNLPSGITQSRTIEAISDNIVTVSTAYGETPEAESVWAVESDDLYVQQFRIVSVSDNNDGTFTISGVRYDPDKFARIDDGAVIPDRPDSVLPINNQAAPSNVQISATSLVSQGLSVATMHVTWDKADGAIAYEAQWRRDSGNWISVPRSSVTGFDITGIYAGNYLVRVCAFNVADVASAWAYSEETTLTGKEGKPPVPVGLRATTDKVFAVELSWGFGENSGDTSYTEIQYTTHADGTSATLLSDVAYPSHNYVQSGLAAGVAFYYRARLVDRLGNQSDWTDWVSGASSSDAADILGDITDAIEQSQAWQEMNQQIDPLADATIENALANDADVQRWRKENGKVVAQIVEIRTTVADQDKAFAQFEQVVGVELDDMSAAVDTKATAKFDATGQGYAAWDTGAQVTYNGQTASAGLSVYAEVDGGNITAGVLVKAGQFSVMQPNGSGWLSPFTIKNQQVFINQEFVENSSITNAKIADAAITNAKISGDIQSDNFSANDGWQISKASNTMTFRSSSSGAFMDATGFGVKNASGITMVKLGARP